MEESFMTLSISNIIWKKGKEHFEDFLNLIAENNVNAIELSLNSIFEEPLDMKEEDFIWLNNLLAKYNVSISALHSLTYTRPDLELFSSKEKRDELLLYMYNYLEIAKKLNTKNIVYGSPKSRKIYNITQSEANAIFLDFLRKIDLHSNNVNFNIEPLPKLYCDYLNTYDEGVKLIESEAYDNIFIQLDIRSIIENKENIKSIFKNSKYLRHVHIGEPDLKMSENSIYASTHESLNSELREVKYTGYLSIEVINHSQNNFKKYTQKIIQRTRNYYGK